MKNPHLPTHYLYTRKDAVPVLPKDSMIGNGICVEHTERMKVCDSAVHPKAAVVFVSGECPLCVAIHRMPKGVPDSTIYLSNYINPTTKRKFSVRANNVFERIGARTMNDLKGWSLNSLLKVKNCGMNTAKEIISALDSYEKGTRR